VCSQSQIVVKLCCLQGVQLLAGESEVVGPWQLHLAPAPSKATASESKGAVSGRLHYLGVRLQDGQQLVQLKQFMLQALSETARRLGWVVWGIAAGLTKCT